MLLLADDMQTHRERRARLDRGRSAARRKKASTTPPAM